jgi:hypothetical protein
LLELPTRIRLDAHRIVAPELPRWQLQYVLAQREQVEEASIMYHQINENKSKKLQLCIIRLDSEEKFERTN